MVRLWYSLLYITYIDTSLLPVYVSTSYLIDRYNISRKHLVPLLADTDEKRKELQPIVVNDSLDMLIEYSYSADSENH